MPTCLDNIPFQLDRQLLMEQLHVQEGSDDANLLHGLADAAQAVARPKVLYQVASVERLSDSQVKLDGIALTSRVLRVNLDHVHRVFAFVATCGHEVELWAGSVTGFLERYWADAIMELAVRTALDALRVNLEARYAPGYLAMMNPGSLHDWPLTEQRALFDVVGDPAFQIGVQLTESSLMRPMKSVSGLLFATDVAYENCQLCPIENCPNRRAPYDSALYDRKYRPSAQASASHVVDHN